MSITATELKINLGKYLMLAETEDIYYPATAEIVGNQIKVYSKEVKNPLHVRYGWQPFTRANLVNGAGLPASTFRTDWGK